jgi:pimeloyl-ACP methyl ester carboxylesterase
VLATLGSSDWVGEKTGVGEPEIIALHGWGRSGADFGTILQGTNAIALHLPGFGPTVAPPEAWSSADYADHLAAALADFPPVILVGHSFGGRVAVRLAARHPERVKALVLTGVPLTKTTRAAKPALAFRVARALHALKLLPEQTMESLRQQYGSADYRAATGVMRQILVKAVAEDYLEDAARVLHPVIMVWGELDQSAPVAAARKALDCFPNATLRVVPQASHLLEGSLEEGVAKAVSDASKL